MSLYPVISTTLDIYGIVVCLVMIWCLCRGNAGRKKLSRIFVWMCVFNIGMLLGDIPNWLCEGYDRSWYPFVLWAGCLLLYLSGISLLLTYTKYVICYLEPKTEVHKAFSFMVDGIAVLYLILVLFSQYNGMFYWIDDANVYHRGSWYLLSQAFAVAVLLLDTLIVFLYRRYLRRKEFLAFGGYIILPIASVIVQTFTYGLSLTYTASTVALLVIFIDIQTEQAFLVEQMEKKLLKEQVAKLISQVQPHFLYNSLIAIASLCISDARLAREETLNLARYMRENLDSINNIEGVIPFKEELQHTNYYLSLEKLRFKERLRVEYNLGPVDFFIPPLTLQTIVENAVRHGIMKRERGGLVVIATEENETDWLVTVTDDGPGFNAEDGLIRDGVKHVGLYNVQHRLEWLCDGGLSIASGENMGTLVTVRIPKKADKERGAERGDSR